MLRASGRRCALNTRRRWKRSLLCELLHVRLQHCGRRAGVGNWSLRRLCCKDWRQSEVGRSEEHTSELQSLMRISYAVFCLKKKKKKDHTSCYQKSTNVQSSTTQRT